MDTINREMIIQLNDIKAMQTFKDADEKAGEEYDNARIVITMQERLCRRRIRLYRDEQETVEG
jgi:hypothetical protein